jgi:manganese/zinc/iron transport system permease protein
MIFIAAFSAIISSLAGTYVSFIESSMPTGPWIVFFMSMIAFLAFMFAPKKGILSKYIKQLQNKAKIREENLLKIFYNLGEKEGNFTQSRTVNELSMAKNYNFTNIYSLLFSLRRHGYIEKNGNAYTLTKAGYQKGKRVTKAHRLWESYLSEHLLIPADHVHHNADAVEHLISPELEQEIRNSLTNPNLDPHQTKIPK